VHHNSRTNTGQPTVELYVTDGTVNPSPTRNFHNVTAGMPSSAVFCLALFDKIETTFTRGDFFFFPNLRCKTRQAQSLELNWSEKISQAQKAQGWTTKRAPKVGADDPRAKEIEA
jgi:hypothetical protein